MAKTNGNRFLVCFLLLLVFCGYGESSSGSMSQKREVKVKEYCVAIPLPSVADSELETVVKSVCAMLNCKAIQPGGACFSPNTALKHASYALNLLFRARNVCDTQIGALTVTNPFSVVVFSNGESSAPIYPEQGIKAYCVAIWGISTEQTLQAFIDYACGVADCTGIQPGGDCYYPVTTISHASYALNQIYRMKNVCNTDIGAVTVTNPSYGPCIYP